MKKIKLCSNQFTFIDTEDYPLIKDLSWGILLCHGKIYAVTSRCKHYMHRLIINAQRGDTVLHIDGNGLNNQKSNLRIVTNTLKNIQVVTEA